jgi:hypothetical protein
MTNKGFIAYNVEQRLRDRGFDVDTVDVDSLVDSTLGLDENLDNIEEYLQTNLRQNSFDGRWRSYAYSEEAEEIHGDRSRRAQRIDNQKRAEQEFDSGTLTKKEFKLWKKNPNRLDITGVDNEESFF